MNQILLVEDDKSLGDALSLVLQKDGYSVVRAASAEEALNATRVGANFACILTDFKLPGKNGVEFVALFREHDRVTPIIMMTAYGSVNLAVEAMKQGANDFLTKPFEPARLAEMLSQVIVHKRIVHRSKSCAKKLVGNSEQLQGLLKQAKKVARVDTSVMILGESGTGKELLARFIHEHSTRVHEPFVAVNCAAMPPELLESEFFGHEAGAFTGATQNRIGVLEYASQGTIFLDEVGDMPLSLQVKLLRALQEKEIRRVGSNKIIKVSPRVVAATNHDIVDLVKAGQMREDFFYRIAVMTLNLSPLRERPQDLPDLVDHFVGIYSNKFEREAPQIHPDSWEALRAYPWPGNARELENVIERAMVFAQEQVLPEHLGIELLEAVNEVQSATLGLQAISERAARQAEQIAINQTLQQTAGNKTRAAQLLGVSYKTLLNKIKEYRATV